MDDLEVDALALRQPDEVARLRARLLDHRRERRLDPLRRHAGRVLPARVALGLRTLAREQLLEPLVRGSEDRLVGVGRPHPVAPFDLVGVRAGLARKHAGVRAQADHLVAQPAVVELAEQGLGGGGDRARVDRRLRVDGGRELRRAEVGVDHAVDVPADLQSQPEVALGDFVHTASISSRRDGPRGRAPADRRGPRAREHRLVRHERP